MSPPINTAILTPSLRQIRDLPGPPRLPLLGNALQIRPRRLHLDLEQWARDHGPFYQLALGTARTLVVAGHEAVGAILRDRPDGFRRPHITAEVSLEMGGPPGLFMAEGDDWRRQRRMVMQAFAPGNVKACFPALKTVALRLRQRWERSAAAGQAIDLTDDLKRYTVDIICGLAFGTEVNTVESGEDVIQQHIDVILPATARRSILPPYWRYIRLPADRRLDRSVAALRLAIEGFLANARARLQAEPARRERPDNLLEAMLVAADQDGSGITDAMVAGNVLTTLMAGEDTTANTLAWLIYLLQRHPAALKQAQDEVRRLAPDAAAFEIGQIDALDYLDACVQEAMRLKPVAPFLPLEALRDSVVGDIHVPAGSIVCCLMRHDSVADNHLENAAGFEPRRWLDAAANVTVKKLSTPFGIGLRTCPGRYLAMLEIKTAMAMLLGGFEIAAVDTPDGNEAREQMGFVVAPVGLSMRLRRAVEVAGLAEHCRSG